jgi:2-dehydropantoate 2-reductase
VRFAIVGAGATGGYLGAKLTRAGVDVVLIARGAHLAAMRAAGLTVRAPDEEFTVRPECTDDLAALGGVDVAVLTLKAPSLPVLAPRLAASLGHETAVVSAQNGIPWWYFQKEGGRLEGTRLESVDPGGAISAAIPAGRVIGCVVYPATRLAEPGVVEHIEGNRFSIGELDGSRSQRCQEISAAFTSAGLKCPIQSRLRQEIWLKLLGNAALNPISALGRATLGEIVRLSETRDLARTLMEEVDSVARALGIEVELGIERRLEGAGRVGEHKTSMLQDVEAGRPLEVEALVGSVVELGDRLDVPLPALKAVYACTKLLDQTLREGAAG